MNIARIKQTIFSAAITVIAAMTLWSCTQNNGEIDPWFGFWRLTSLTVDGEPVEDYDNNIVWSFQNNIIMIDIYGDHEEYIESWGTWTCNDEETLMTLDFSHRDDTENKGQYAPPAVLGFSREKPNTLTIEGLSSRKAVLSTFSAKDGHRYVYKLEKVY